ncbi:hypothetical protein LTR37_017016 [Vermiconidia calcicola]|uniref:Uncharacterized protein n=1 Tax=Vermiconidia calcicola TaxID=1690605 RepID=A0ACC3MM70_9PEZI|nr:hypothetical protein LTR37_017016 [Vermiconidia calcicola]
MSLEMEQGTKRKADDGGLASANDKRQKNKQQWRVPRRHEGGANALNVIKPGDSGIWATCNKGKERACIGELRDFFTEYADNMYEDGPTTEAMEGVVPTSEAQSSGGIESEIQSEIADMRQPGSRQLFTPLRVDVQCVVFFKTIAPVEPVSFIKTICEDAMNASRRKRTRWAKRLSPMTLMGRASEEGLEKVATEVLAPHFHRTPFQRRKFAIRPTLRNHNILSRDSIIRQIATIVGPGHEVSLKDYDLLIIVEVYQNVCGVSVLDNSFERLKRYNLAEIFDPTPASENANPERKEMLASSAE